MIPLRMAVALLEVIFPAVKDRSDHSRVLCSRPRFPGSVVTQISWLGGDPDHGSVVTQIMAQWCRKAGNAAFALGNQPIP